MELLGQDLVCEVESNCQVLGYSISGMPRTPARLSINACLVAKPFQPILRNHQFQGDRHQRGVELGQPPSG